MKLICILSIFLIVSCAPSTDEEKVIETAEISDSLIDNSADSIVKTVIEEFVEPPELTGETHIDGKAVIVLRPDSLRFDSYLQNGEEWIYEVDSDFAFGILGALDSLEQMDFFKSIHTEFTEDRYIVLEANGKPDYIIDRDSLAYGIILTQPGKAVLIDDNIYGESYYYQIIYDYFVENSP